MNLEGKGGGGSEGVGKLLDMDAGEVGALCHNHRMGETVGTTNDVSHTIVFWGSWLIRFSLIFFCRRSNALPRSGKVTGVLCYARIFCGVLFPFYETNRYKTEREKDGASRSPLPCLDFFFQEGYARCLVLSLGICLQEFFCFPLKNGGPAAARSRT